jgi:YjbR
MRGSHLELKIESMSYTEERGVSREVLGRLRLVCLELPEVVEEEAWQGTRWSVRGKNFAHVLSIAGGKPEAYARAAGTFGPACVLTFRLAREHLAAARFRRAPFFRPVWFPNIAGVLVDPGTDWDEVDTLLRASYRALAPKKLGAQVE